MHARDILMNKISNNQTTSTQGGQNNRTSPGIPTAANYGSIGQQGLPPVLNGPGSMRGSSYLTGNGQYPERNLPSSSRL